MCASPGDAKFQAQQGFSDVKSSEVKFNGARRHEAPGEHRQSVSLFSLDVAGRDAAADSLRCLECRSAC